MDENSMVEEKLKIEWVPMDKLFEDEENARRHNERNLASIKNSLKQFGLRKPIVALRSGKIIAGNGTFRAAKDLGWTELAVCYFDTNDEHKAIAYALADNRTAELAEWDLATLAILVKRIEPSFPSAVLGWEPMEINPILNANWQPKEIQPFDSNEENFVHVIRLNSEQKLAFENAAENIRKEHGEEVTDGQCIKIICERYLG